MDTEDKDDVTFTAPTVLDPYFPAPVLPPADEPLQIVDLSKVVPGPDGEITITYTLSGKLA